MGTTFYTSDQHFGHERIAALAGRPFASVPEMNEVLVARWNERVGHDDTVYLLGDVALGRLDASLTHVGRLNGRKILVPGNHDRCWLGDRQVRESPERLAAAVDRYLSAGFAQVVDPTLTPGRALRLPAPDVALSHFPYAGDSHGTDRYTPLRPVDDGETWLVHGHVHTQWRQRGRQINVGVDAWAGYPVAEETVLALIAAGERELAPLPW